MKIVDLNAPEQASREISSSIAKIVMNLSDIAHLNISTIEQRSMVIFIAIVQPLIGVVAGFLQ